MFLKSNKAQVAVDAPVAAAVEQKETVVPEAAAAAPATTEAVAEVSCPRVRLSCFGRQP